MDQFSDDFSESMARAVRTYSTDAEPSASQMIAMIAVIVSGSLYLLCVFVGAMINGNREAMILALGDIGLCYLVALLQLAVPQARMTALALVFLSIVVGYVAGLFLIG